MGQEQVGREVRNVKLGDFVVGSFMASDGTCEICQAGCQSRCAQVEFVGAGGAQAEYLHGGPAPVRRFLPQLISRIEDQAIDPGKGFDLTLPLSAAAEGCRAMDERRAVKTLLRS
jgi:threonine dehydrogenase-like Zn-dependent dehydrogenase